jgi:hypothetical protein
MTAKHIRDSINPRSQSFPFESFSHPANRFDLARIVGGVLFLVLYSNFLPGPAFFFCGSIFRDHAIDGLRDVAFCVPLPSAQWNGEAMAWHIAFIFCVAT